MNIRSRLQRLEKAWPKSSALENSGRELSDAEVTTELHAFIPRFLAGESREDIARSRGRPWNPLPQTSLTDDKLRELTRRLIAPAMDTLEAEAVESPRSDFQFEDG